MVVKNTLTIAQNAREIFHVMVTLKKNKSQVAPITLTAESDLRVGYFEDKRSQSGSNYYESEI